ncbi:hypothetical protein [Natrialba sp. INN-245]|uniref:DUF7827 domain-containing protein n=1 Tax=Natrialba sp. INN-245 TaxID=2690967 RepID=UPI001313527A|nr:hypothetical protein [Natrialba sp. INN-245]MWV39444.1 hypothetical protein [Natrialba sp. INN-245]
MIRPSLPVSSRSILLIAVLSCVVAGGILASTDSAEATEPVVLEEGDDFVYEGQDVEIDVADRFDVSEGDELYLYELDGGEIETVAERPTVDDDGRILLETGEIDEDGPQFAITPDSGLDGDELVLTIDEQEFDVEWASETVTSGTNAVSLEVDSTRAGGYNVTISVDDFEYEELRATFVHEGSDVEEVTDPAHLPLEELGYDRDDGDDVTDLRGDDYITLNVADSEAFRDDDEIVANLMSLDEREGLPDEGEYEFDVVVADTGVEDSSTLEIGETAASFDEDMYVRPAGDLLEITVELEAADEAWLQLGDKDVGFVDVLYVEDDSDTDEVTFTMNTRLAGVDHGEVDGLGPADADAVYYAEDDVVESYIHHETVAGEETRVSDASFYDGSDLETASQLSFSEYLERLGTIDAGQEPTEQIDRPIQPGNYDLVVDRGQNFVVEDGESSADDTIGSAELGLIQPSVDDVDTWTAPQAEANAEDDIEELPDELSERDTVAIGDRAVARFEATGITGALATIDYAENGNDITDGTESGFSPNALAELTSDGSDWLGEGVEFSFDGPDVPNQEPNAVALEDAANTEAYVLASPPESDDDDGELYVVVDTEDGFAQDVDDGDEFTVSLAYEGSESRYQFDGESGSLGGSDGDADAPAYPYFSSEQTESATTTLTFERASITFDRTDDGLVALPTDSDGNVSGTTNVAPGTEATLNVRSGPPEEVASDGDSSYLDRQSITIEERGSFATNPGFDEYGSFEVSPAVDSRTEGERAYVEFRLWGEIVAEGDAVFADLSDDRPAYFEPTIDVPASVSAGDTFDLNATIRNAGDEHGTLEVRTTVGSAVESNDEIELGPGQNETVEETVEATNETEELLVTISTQDEAAFATVAVGDTNESASNATDDPDEATETDDGTDAVGTFGDTGSDWNSSNDESGAETDDDLSSDDGSPGFGVVTTGVALAVLSARLGRRREGRNRSS